MNRLNNDDSARLLTQAIDRYFPRLALVLSGAPREAELVDLLIHIHPDVKIFARDRATIEAIQSRHYVTPLRFRGTVASIAREWDLEAILTTRINAVAERGHDGIIRINPLAARRAVALKG
jgi:predicted component of type VI protein secretion system